jgi:hypothetical protein
MKHDIEKRFNMFKDKNHSVLDIDNGCVFSGDGYNHLCCLNLTDMTLLFNKNID